MEMHSGLINHPGAWTAKSLGGKEGITLRFSDRQLAALDELLAKTPHLKPQQPSRAQFDHPDLNDFLATMRKDLLDGKGAALLVGITRERYSEEDFERILWGFGLHWGDAVMQSDLGDRIGHVRFEPNLTKVRGYRSQRELKVHTDVNEIVSLMSVQKSEVGGMSRLVSGLALHNEIWRTKPNLMRALYEGYPRWIFEKLEVTKYPVPILSCVKGKVSASLYGIEEAMEAIKTPPPADFVEGFNLFRELSVRDDICLSFVLEPGEIMVWSNFTCLHARTAFEDTPEQRRHLLRLWLDCADGRPIHPAYTKLAAEYRNVNETVPLRPALV